MIEQVDEHLKAWLMSIVDGTEVSLATPVAPEKGRTIGLYLLEVIPMPILRGGARRPPRQFALRYLITTGGESPEEAHQMLGKLILAAMENPDFEVESEPLALGMWTALGAAPRPSLVLRAPLRVERPQLQGQRVHSLSVSRAQMLPLEGLVLGPGDIPLAGAQVEVPAQQLFTHTDYRGRFRFPALGSGPRGTVLRVRARGFELTASVADSERTGKPLTLRFERMEE